MGERLPGSFQAMARASGFGDDEEGVTAFYKAVEAGEIKATEVFPKFSEELMKMANEGGALERAMNNTAAAVGRFRTNVYLANKTLNESGYDKAVRRLMNRSSEAIDRSTPFWDLLGKALNQAGKAAEVPIELFGALNERLPIMIDYVERNATAFKLFGAAIVAAFAPLRSIFLLIYGVASISDLLLDPDRERSWAEWVVQLGLAAAAFATIFGLLKKIFTVGKNVKGLFKSSGTLTQTGSKAPKTATSGSGAGKAKKLGKMGLRSIPYLGSALIALDAAEMMGVNDWVKGAFSSGSTSPLLGAGGGVSSGSLPFGPQMLGQGKGLLNDGNIDAYLKSMQGGLLNDGNIDAYLNSQRGNKSQETRQFIGDVNITVESPDPEQAGFKVEQAFQNIFSRELRLTSTSQQITEK